MIPKEETFDGTWPFAANYFDGQGFLQHFVDEGARDGAETFVLLHGEPTWGYLWRALIPVLSARGRVIVPDHMGFGKSETPQDRAYSAQEHTENLEALLLHLDLRDVTLVMHDWGGPLGGQFALRNPERVKRIVLADSFVTPPGPPPLDIPREVLRNSTRWFELVHDDDFADVIQNMRFTALSVLQRIGFRRTEVVDDTWVRAYSAPFPTRADTKGAQQFPLNLTDPATYAYFDEGLALPGAVEALRSKPAALFTGAEDPTVAPPIVEMMFRQHWPAGPVVVIPGAGHYVSEDAPETLAALIEGFVQQTG